MSNQDRHLLKLASCLAIAVLANASIVGASSEQPSSNGDGQPDAMQSRSKAPAVVPRPGPGAFPTQTVQRGDGQESLIIDLDFAGGTIAQYITAVQESTGRPFNVITSPEVAAMRLGPVRLRSASSTVVVEAIVAALVDRDERVQLRTQSLAHGGAESYTIRAERLPAMAFPGQPAMLRSDRADLVGTYSIATLVNPPADDLEAKRLPQDDVTKAIEAVLRLVASPTPPKILIHPETSLLVVQGTGEHLNLAEGVIKQLKDDLNLTREADRVVRDQAERERQFEKSRADQVSRFEDEHRTAMRLVVTIRDRISKLQADSKGDAPEAKQALAEAVEELSRVNREKEQVEQQLRAFRLGQFNNVADLNMLSNEVARLRREFEAFKAQRAPATAK
ncbi:MAG: hypothetical protein K2W85_06995 [Phycisphaerales bacterium]|nr:hypothetical protein [Phycisphaerales bacterium]